MTGYYGGFMGNVGGMGGLIAGGPSFEINKRPGALGGRSGEQLKRLYEGGTQQNQQLNEELMRRGIMPGGPKLPMVMGVPGAPGNFGGIAMNTPDPGLVEKQQQEKEYLNNLNTDSGAVRFTPSQLNVQPKPGYNLQPGYNPFNVDLERDRFILHSPKSGVANMPVGFMNKFVS